VNSQALVCLICLIFLSNIVAGCISESDIDLDNINDNDDNCIDVFNPSQLNND
jgi:hypothetical protein